MLAHVDEACPDAVRRTRPDAVLLDTVHPCASSPEFFEEAAALGVRVVALAPDSRNDHARAVARRRMAACVTLPTEYDLVPTRLALAELA